jgi:hypothetical protein
MLNLNDARHAVSQRFGTMPEGLQHQIADFVKTFYDKGFIEGEKAQATKARAMTAKKKPKTKNVFGQEKDYG